MAHILVTEPDEFFAKFYSLKLKQAGFKVDRETDGIKTFKKLKENNYDLILMNLMLPRKNGFTLLENKEKTANSDTPIIIISELNQEKDKDEAEKLGITDYFVKNKTQIEEVIQKVTDLLQENHASKTTEQSNQEPKEIAEEDLIIKEE